MEGSCAATLHERADVSPRSSGRRYGRVNGTVDRTAFASLPFAVLRDGKLITPRCLRHAIESDREKEGEREKERKSACVRVKRRRVDPVGWSSVRCKQRVVEDADVSLERVSRPINIYFEKRNNNFSISVYRYIEKKSVPVLYNFVAIF